MALNDGQKVILEFLENYLHDAHLTYTRGNHDNPVRQQVIRGVDGLYEYAKRDKAMKTEITITRETIKNTVQFGKVGLGHFFEWGDKLYIKTGPYSEDRYNYRGTRVGGMGPEGKAEIHEFPFDYEVTIPKAVKIRVINKETEQ